MHQTILSYTTVAYAQGHERWSHETYREQRKEAGTEREAKKDMKRRRMQGRKDDKKQTERQTKSIEKRGLEQGRQSPAKLSGLEGKKTPNSEEETKNKTVLPPSRLLPQTFCPSMRFTHFIEHSQRQNPNKSFAFPCRHPPSSSFSSKGTPTRKKQSGAKEAGKKGSKERRNSKKGQHEVKRE
mmetsp:Transcript_13188/g.25953  ORF Transcript_13188/g.25953 Transcript_13188/m.25953 type:complete len:183 (-) Transcript_13188:253-801(-)